MRAEVTKDTRAGGDTAMAAALRGPRSRLEAEGRAVLGAALGLAAVLHAAALVVAYNLPEAPRPREEKREEAIERMRVDVRREEPPPRELPDVSPVVVAELRWEEAPPAEPAGGAEEPPPVPEAGGGEPPAAPAEPIEAPPVARTAPEPSPEPSEAAAERRLPDASPVPEALEPPPEPAPVVDEPLPHAAVPDPLEPPPPAPKKVKAPRVRPVAVPVPDDETPSSKKRKERAERRAVLAKLEADVAVMGLLSDGGGSLGESAFVNVLGSSGDGAGLGASLDSVVMGGVGGLGHVSSARAGRMVAGGTVGGGLKGSGGGPGTGPGMGSVGLDEDALLRAYARKVAAALKKGSSYPPQAARRRLEGVVMLELTIDGDGAVSALRVARSSGHAILDDAALGAARKVDRVPKPPKALSWTRRALRVPFTFRLGP